MLQIFAKEFSSFLNSLIAYVVIGVFLLAIGLLMWVFPDSSVLEYGYADMSTLFSLGPYVLIFLIPAVTMRSFSEEKKGGTMELLFTKPLTDWDIILGKFFASFALVLLALLPTLVYYYSLYTLGNPRGNIDTPGIIGSYIGLAMLAAVFSAIGIMASSMSANQIVAFILAAFLCYITFAAFDAISGFAAWGSRAFVVGQFGILFHYESMSRGLIDSRDLIYFVSVIFIALSVTKLTLSSRQW
jgi:ABC-2 type transport system permease protein